MRFKSTSNELDRVNDKINSRNSPINFEPINTNSLVDPGYWNTNKSQWVSKNDFRVF